MFFWKENTFMQLLGSCIWNTSECLKIPLGAFAPTVFEWMIGVKKNKLQENDENIEITKNNTRSKKQG